MGRPPKLVQKIEKENKKLGDNDPWRRERCYYCQVIIGKDYGSFGHVCPEGAAYRAYMQPQWDYEGELKEYNRAIFLNQVKDRLFRLRWDF